MSACGGSWWRSGAHLVDLSGLVEGSHAQEDHLLLLLVKLAEVGQVQRRHHRCSCDCRRTGGFGKDSARSNDWDWHRTALESASSTTVELGLWRLLGRRVLLTPVSTPHVTPLRMVVVPAAAPLAPRVVHTAHLAATSHTTPHPSTAHVPTPRITLVLLHATIMIIAAGTRRRVVPPVPELLDLHVDRLDLAVHALYLVLQVLLHLLGLLELLLDDESVVSLHDLLVDELVPRLRVQLVVEVEVVPVRQLRLHLHHFLTVSHLIVDRSAQNLGLCLVVSLLAPVVEADLVGFGREADRLLPSRLDVIVGCTGGLLPVFSRRESVRALLATTSSDCSGV